MATYEEIYGKRVKELSTDPTLNSSYEGQVWYNETTGALKSVVSFGAFVSGGNLNTGRHLGAGGGATSTASLICGGLTPPRTANSEEYNGYVWAEGNDIPTATDGAAFFGIQTAAIAAEGRQPPANAGAQKAYSYDGTSWTAIPDTGTASRNAAGAGVQGAGLIFGGYDNSPGVQNKTIEWNGSSWTNVNNMNIGRESAAGAGVSQTAALSIGGNPNPPLKATESYDGTNWTSVEDLPVDRPESRGATGPQSGAVVTGTPGTVNLYDGSSWSTLPGTMATPRNSAQMSGVGQTNALIFSGNTASDKTEEYNFSINTVTAAAWASGDATNTALGTTAGCGTQTAGLVFSGADNLNNTELYNGSSWTAGPTLGTGRYGAGEAVSAPQTAALCFGGYSNPPGTNRAQTEEFDGSSWSEQTDMPISMRQLSGFGIQTAAVTVGGWTTAYVSESYEYNGSSWTAGGNINVSRERAASFGLESAGATVGGNIPPSHAHTDTAEEYNGTAWTTATAYPTGIKLASACGTQTDGLVFSGNTPPNSVTGLTLAYDGTSWSGRPSMGTARQAGAGAGTSAAALMMAGSNVSGTSLTTTEEFTDVTETITAQTLTTS